MARKMRFAAPYKAPTAQVKHSSKMTAADWAGDFFKRTPQTAEVGFYVYFGMWKGPFTTEELARSAHAEWSWEAKHS